MLFAILIAAAALVGVDWYRGWPWFTKVGSWFSSAEEDTTTKKKAKK